MALVRPMRSVRGVLVALLLSSVATAFGVEAADPPDTPRTRALKGIIDRMIVDDHVLSMKLSPDGKKVAMVTWSASGATGRVWYGHAPGVISVLVMDVATGAVTPIAKPGWGDDRYNHPYSATWVANDRIAVNFHIGNCHIFDLDGKEMGFLGHHLLQVLPARDGRDALAIAGSDEFFDRSALHRANLRTGEEQKIPVDLPDDPIQVFFDASGRLRAAVTAETHWYKSGAQFTTWYRHDEGAPWQVLQRRGVEEGWKVVAIPDDSDTIVVLSREGRDTWALFKFDTKTQQTTQLQAGFPTEDVIAFNEDGRADVRRVITNGLKPTTFWFEEDWQRIQRAVDKALPDAMNVLSGDPRGNVLIHTFSDRDPGRWLVLDTQKMRMKAVGSDLLKFDKSGMRPMETLTYPSLDGLPIPAYLTRPAGPVRPQPLVVFVHGGPVERNYWAWNEDVQVLAAAGYAVLQPQFRGSSGFGKKLEVSGYRQWGLAMQDDITAGVKAMIDRGVADPQRICIYGGSYGGYAALWGLAKTPELYRCGISLSGVTDIGEMFTDWSDVNASKTGPDQMRFMIGDVDTMKSQFDAVSPEKHADRIQAPVLLVHGERDARVPMGHAWRMERALNNAHRRVETRWYPGEGHGLSYQSNRKDFDLLLLDFLDRNIGPGSPFADRWDAGSVTAVPTAASAPAIAASSAGGAVASR
jgi:dipeptidyl aminopeptidase/acylaminoacyl peptidase